MSQDNIFREVDEELRSERMRKAWRRFGPYVIGAAVAVVLAVAVNEGWSWWQSSNAAKASDEFYAALELKDGGDTAAAQAALANISANGSGGYAQLARFAEAGVLAKSGKVDEAVALYDTLGGAEGNVRLRELALILGANLLIDKGDLAGVNQRVLSLSSPENPMRNAAREIIGLTQYKAGNLEEARLNFEAISADQATDNNMRSRVQVYLSQLAAEGAVPVEDDLSATATDPAAGTTASDPAPMVEATPETPAPVQGEATPPAAPVSSAPAAEPVAPAVSPMTEVAPAPVAPAAPATPASAAQPAPTETPVAN